MLKTNTIQIDNAYELLRYFYKNKIEYGFWDYVNQCKVTSEEDRNNKEYIDKQCCILHPYEVIEHNLAVCWDLSMCAYYYLNKFININAYVFFIESFNNRTHASCYYSENKDEWYWFEYSWYWYAGIHGPFPSKKELFININDMVRCSDYKDYIKVANLNVNVDKILKLDLIRPKDFMDICYEGAKFYEKNAITQLDIFKVTEE